MKNLMISIFFAFVFVFTAQSASAFCGGEQTAIIFLFEGQVNTVYVPHDLKVRRTVPFNMLTRPGDYSSQPVIRGEFSVVENEDRDTLVTLVLNNKRLEGKARAFFRCAGTPLYVRWGDKDLPEDDYKKVTKAAYEISDAAKKKP